MLYNNKITFISINKIKPNNWNSNELNSKEFQKLVEDIKINGFVGAIVVRENGNGTYEIIDGEHRWRALKTLGEDKAPCIIKECKEDKAKINSVRWNTERGEQNSKKLALILKSLKEKDGYKLSEIEAELIYDLPDLEDKLSLLDLPENLEDILKEQAEKEATELPIIYSFIVPGKYKEYVDKVFETVEGTKGEALGVVCQKIVTKR